MQRSRDTQPCATPSLQGGGTAPAVLPELLLALGKGDLVQEKRIGVMECPGVDWQGSSSLIPRPAEDAPTIPPCAGSVVQALCGCLCPEKLFQCLTDLQAEISDGAGAAFPCPLFPEQPWG